MQDAGPPKRPVGRPRLSNSHPRPYAQSRRASASALDVAVANVATSNETTNHFLGAGAIQRPWMRSASSAIPRRLSTISASATGPTLSSSPTTAATAVDNVGHDLSNTSSTVYLPPYRFVPSISTTHAEELPAVENARTEAEIRVNGLNDMHSKLPTAVQETSNDQQEIEVMDLTVIDEEITEPVEHGPTSTLASTPTLMSHMEHTTDHNSTSFPELPILEMNSDFDLMTTEATNASVIFPTQAHQPFTRASTTTKSTDSSLELTASPLDASRSTPTDPVAAHAGRDSSNTSNVLTQPSSMASSATYPQVDSRRISLDQGHEKGSTSQCHVSLLTRQPYADATGITQPSSAQLLTPEQSPLNRFTQPLPQNRSVPGVEPALRLPPRPQTRVSNLSYVSSILPHQMSRSQQHVQGQQPGFRPPAQRADIGFRHQIYLQHRGAVHLATLKSTIEDMSRRVDLNSSKWNTRLPWLQDACLRGDMFFLQLHQLFCIWNINTATARVLALEETSDAGFAILELLFGKNKDFPPELLAFLAGWPNSGYSLQYDKDLRDWTSAIASFLPLLGSRWHEFHQRCLERKAPPMASEIIHHLRCPVSVILPSAMFCSIEQQIAPSAPPKLHLDAFALFRMNMRDAYSGKSDSGQFAVFLASYRAIYSRILTLQGLSQTQIDEMRSVLAHVTAMIPLAQPETSAQRQEHNTPAQSSPCSTPTNHVNVAATHPPCGPSATDDTGNRSALNSQSQSLSNNQPAIQSAPRFTSTAPTQQAPAGISNGIQPPLSRLGTAQIDPVRMQDFSAPHIPSVQSPPPNLPDQRRSSSLSSLPLLNSGHAPPAHDRLLPADVQHLPDFIVNPDPVQEALHQIHLRQPVTEIKDFSGGDQQRLFQYIQNLLLRPHTFLPSVGFIAVSFEAPPELLERKAEVVAHLSGPFEQLKRVVRPKSVVFNLRCVQLSDTQTEADIASSWAAVHTHWPQHIFISINEHHLDVRRKRHHGRDLPIDVTSFVRPGKNMIKISIHPEQSERNIMHGFAIEIIGFHNREQALEMLTTIDAETSLKSLISAMTPRPDTDDDDIVLVDDSMTISITDPFSSRMFTTPVRGISCKHRECFDLETYLDSRRGDHGDALTSVYGWQCPICKRDARPCSLIIDEFFQQVRAKLVESGDADARAIIVRADGTWEVKKEVETQQSVISTRGQHICGNSDASPAAANAEDQKPGDAKSRASNSSTNAPNAASVASMTRLPHDSQTTEVIELD